MSLFEGLFKKIQSFQNMCYLRKTHECHKNVAASLKSLLSVSTTAYHFFITIMYIRSGGPVFLNTITRESRQVGTKRVSTKL